MGNPTKRFTLQPLGPFSLEPIRRLQCGFLLGTRTCDALDGAVTVAFPKDGSFEPVAVRLRLHRDEIAVELFGNDDVKAIRPQLERMLAVDRDAMPFFDILGADPVLRRLLAMRPAFRPVVAASPYAMAGWLVLSQRISMAQAARMQVKLSEMTGDFVEVGTERAHAFPSPEKLLKLSAVQGISEEKWRRLQAVAAAAVEGKLEQTRLLSKPYEQAREELMTIRGVGPWTADGILIRGCGPNDVLPLGEPTLHGAIQAAYGLETLPTDEEVIARANAWRPFRTWVSVFLISADYEASRALSVGSRRGSPTLRRPVAA